MNHSSYKFIGRRERGATLIVSLVILAVITLLGVARMRSSNLQLKMAASARDRAVAFQAAETVLNIAEAEIQAANFPLNSFLPTCTGNKCFNKNCNNGLCFTGDMESAQTIRDCRLAPPDGNLVAPSWVVEGNWKDKAITKQVAVKSVKDAEDNVTNKAVNVKYMVEFMCFVPKDEKAIVDENNQNTGTALYRITARARGDADRSEVMLQSIYKGGRVY